MRIIIAIFILLITVFTCFILDSRILLPAPLGKLLSPQQGIWQNADPSEINTFDEINFPLLTGKTDVYFDERLVPHIFAENENDAYFVQGYLHAKYRLWQMELQCLAAAGRASEIVGTIAFEHDREYRRLGMVYAAENALKEMESDPVIKAACDNYTSGVNAYIETLTESSLPIEYKLLGYHPEKWSNFKSALFLKNMSYELAAHENDFELTNAHNYFKPEQFRLLFPLQPDSIDPVIPAGTQFTMPGVTVKAPVRYDSINVSAIDLPVGIRNMPDKNNGSNNWAVAGSKTFSGSPILCNDPHLGLNLPSLWYELQISTPQFNVYGVSFPGAPSVVIGFNDSCSWGVTNGGRDVRDYYEIKFRDDSRKEYLFNDQWLKTSFRYEVIKVAGSADFIDTVAYTIIGPVMYDNRFGEKRNPLKKAYAVRWKAHDPSNELKTFYLLNRARNYHDYENAVSQMHTPGQNFAFAAKNGDIAMRAQGSFPAKWKEQGDYIMPGTDSSYFWQSTIPQSEVPSQFNPERGFISSANQQPADTTYPYYLGKDYPTIRGRLINRMLRNMNSATVQDMMAMQTNNYNLFAEMAKPLFIRNILTANLSENELKYWNVFSQWNLYNDAGSMGATIFEIFWKQFYHSLYDDEYKNAPLPCAYPRKTTALESILKDSAYVFIDDIATEQKESLNEIVTISFKKTVTQLDSLSKIQKLVWWKYKNTHISHLLKLESFSRAGMMVGGGDDMINATRSDHGPSWRMIVHLTPETEAYGVFPGGQSGNPGSRFYDMFIDQWAAGKYYRLWMMKPSDKSSPRIISKIYFHS